MLDKEIIQKRIFRILLFLSVIITWGCHPERVNREEAQVKRMLVDSLLTKGEIADKVMGALIGSAIGDAMGAPTEMWDRRSIRIQYGHIDTLDPHTREASPEGPWDHNLPSGGTTDDTRWKALISDFLTRSPIEADTLDARAFSRHVVKTYLEYIQALKATESFDPEPYEREVRRMTWLQEWAQVAKPYAEGDYENYIGALNRFYGGEMACAGMLYAPVIGIYYAGVPELAYQEGYRLGIFDHGYARDITGLTAAITAAAAGHQSDPEECLSVIRDVDPQHFFKSRLLGRTAHRIYQESRSIAYEARNYAPSAEELAKATPPSGWKNSKTAYLKQEKAFELLEPKLQEVPFHAGEIWLITLTGLQMYEWEFLPSLEFIINFGRDNDTTGAVAGAILGAYHGASKLPPELTSGIIKTHREILHTDLEMIAGKLTETIWERHH